MENTTFKDLGVCDELLQTLEKMEFTTPTPVQALSIHPFLEGDDLLVQAPTGTGKTCAFGIPAMQKTDSTSPIAQVLVLSPTRELALQTADVFKQLAAGKAGLRVVTLYGGERIEKQFAALRSKPQIIVATPGRLLDHMQRKTVRLHTLHTVILDEADRMLDMGFRPDLHKILAQAPKQRQTVLYSATLSKEILAIAAAYQQNARTLTIEQDSLTVDTVTQYYTEVYTGTKNQALLALLHEKRFPLSLVFVNAKHKADRIALLLKKHGINAAALHGDMNQNQRERVMRQYRRGELEALIATDVASRGIDVQNIDAVINYDIPGDNDSYVHRIGRTGRANQTGLAFTFLYEDERPRLYELMRTLNADIQPTPESLSSVRLEEAVAQYAAARKTNAQFSAKLRRGSFRRGHSPRAARM